MERSESLREAGWLPPDRALIEQAASDWSEIRPEWGLAGNRAMFIGPRSLTAGANLQGECFLHSYDFHLDPDGELLGRILAGPLMVGVMINTQ